jgi:hypothetical protein
MSKKSKNLKESSNFGPASNIIKGATFDEYSSPG